MCLCMRKRDSERDVFVFTRISVHVCFLFFSVVMRAWWALPLCHQQYTTQPPPSRMTWNTNVWGKKTNTADTLWSTHISSNVFICTIPLSPLPFIIGILSNLSNFFCSLQVTGKSPGTLWPCLADLHSQVSAIQTYAVDNDTQRQKDTRTYLAVHTIIIIGQLIRAALDIWRCPSRHFVVFVVETAFSICVCVRTHWNLDNYPCKQQSLWQWWQVEGQGSFNGVFCPWCILGQSASWPLHPAWNNITFTSRPLNQASLSKRDWFWSKSHCVDISHLSYYFLIYPLPPKTL